MKGHEHCGRSTLVKRLANSTQPNDDVIWGETRPQIKLAHGERSTPQVSLYMFDMLLPEAMSIASAWVAVAVWTITPPLVVKQKTVNKGKRCVWDAKSGAIFFPWQSMPTS